jgi:hypothetical protein
VRIAGGMFDKAMQNIGRPNSDAWFHIWYRIAYITYYLCN